MLTEQRLGLPGIVFKDPTADDLYELFLKLGSVYFVAEVDREIIGLWNVS